MTTGEQLDMLAELPAQDRGTLGKREVERNVRKRALDLWQERLPRAMWVAPYDTAGGMKKGDSVLGWKCPACGKIVPNDFLLGLNHGLHAGRVPQDIDFMRLTTCTAMAHYREPTDAEVAEYVAFRVAAGIDDETQL